MVLLALVVASAHRPWRRTAARGPVSLAHATSAPQPSMPGESSRDACGGSRYPAPCARSHGTEQQALWM
eukprot:2621243-Rhodomonas_salina.2